MNLPITLPATIRRNWRLRRSRGPLAWLILAALLLGLFGVYCVAQLILFWFTPYNTPYGRDLLSKAVADYSPWNAGPGLPAIGPNAANAADQDLAGDGPLRTVPAALVPLTSAVTPTLTPTPSATQVAAILVASPTEPPAPTPSATPSPTELPTEQPVPEAAVTQAPALTQEPTQEPTATEPPVPTQEPTATETAAAIEQPTRAPRPTSTSPAPIVGQSPQTLPTAKQPQPGGTADPDPIEPPTPTRAPTRTPTAAPTSAPTSAPTATASSTPTPSPTATASSTATATPTATRTATATPTATATSTPTPANHAPQAVDDSALTNEDTPVVLDVLANDSDPDGDALMVAGGTQPTHGSVTISGTLLTYTPAPDFNGDDSFTYRVCDQAAQSLCNGAFVRLRVAPVNDAPSFVASSDPVGVLEDSGVYSASWASELRPGPATASDELTQTLRFIVVNDNPGLFSAQGQPQVDRAGRLSFTPAPDAFGSSTLLVALDDGAGAVSAPLHFKINVQPVNDAPSFKVLTDTVTSDEDQSYSADWAAAISGPANEAAQTRSFDVAVIANPGLFAGLPVIDGNGNLSFTPALNQNGTATLSVTLHDDGGTLNGGQDSTAPYTFTVTVLPVNDAPLAKNDAFTVAKNSANNILRVLDNDNDPEGDALTIKTITPTLNAMVTIVGKTLNYTPAPNFSGTDTITYTVCDNGTTHGKLASKCGTAVVTVTVGNTPPNAKDDNATVVAGSQTTINVLANDSDANGDALTISPTLVVSPTHGQVIMASDRKLLSYRPIPGFSGQDSFVYRVSDGTDTTTATVRVNVTSAFNAGSCEAISVQPTVRDTGLSQKALTVTLLANSTVVISDVYLELRVFTNTLMTSPTTTLANEQLITATGSETATTVAGTFPEMRFMLNGPHTASSYDFTLTYSYSANAALTNDDSFRAWFTAGGKRCVISGSFPSSSADPPIAATRAPTVTFVTPISDSEVITSEAATNFEVAVTEATTNTAAFVAWRIVEVSSGKTVHAWTEYSKQWCAFGNQFANGAGPCATPATADRPHHDLDWWQQLNAGDYRIEVYAQGSQGNASPIISRTFKKT